MLEIDKLNKELYNQKKLNNNISQKCEEIQAKFEEREKTINNLQVDMANQSRDIEKLKSEIKEFELKLETYLTEKNFLLQVFLNFSYILLINIKYLKTKK